MAAKKKNDKKSAMEYPIDITKSLREIVDFQDITARDIIQTEAMLWGFNKDTDEFKVLNALADIKPTKPIRMNGLKYTKALESISKSTGMYVEDIEVVLHNILEKANFSKSLFIPVFAKMNKEDIGTAGIIKQLYDYVISEFEE